MYRRARRTRCTIFQLTNHIIDMWCLPKIHKWEAHLSVWATSKQFARRSVFRAGHAVLSFHLIDTKGFYITAENERFSAVDSPVVVRTLNVKIARRAVWQTTSKKCTCYSRNFFLLLIGRRPWKITIFRSTSLNKCLLRVQHNYFSSFSQRCSSFVMSFPLQARLFSFTPAVTAEPLILREINQTRKTLLAK